eukprot:scaffold6501_cov109-Skeletonema_marinoi.AAC.4
MTLSCQVYHITSLTPQLTVFCFGHTAPCGMFQVPEEEIDSVAELMRLLEIDVLGPTCCMA